MTCIIGHLMDSWLCESLDIHMMHVYVFFAVETFKLVATFFSVDIKKTGWNLVYLENQTMLTPKMQKRNQIKILIDKQTVYHLYKGSNSYEGIFKFHLGEHID